MRATTIATTRSRGREAREANQFDEAEAAHGAQQRLHVAVVGGGDGLEGVGGCDELLALEGTAQHLDGIGGSLDRFEHILGALLAPNAV